MTPKKKSKSVDIFHGAAVSAPTLGKTNWVTSHSDHALKPSKVRYSSKTQLATFWVCYSSSSSHYSYHMHFVWAYKRTTERCSCAQCKGKYIKLGQPPLKYKWKILLCFCLFYFQDVLRSSEVSHGPLCAWGVRGGDNNVSTHLKSGYLQSSKERCHTSMSLPFILFLFFIYHLQFTPFVIVIIICHHKCTLLTCIFLFALFYYVYLISIHSMLVPVLLCPGHIHYCPCPKFWLSCGPRFTCIPSFAFCDIRQ